MRVPGLFDLQGMRHPQLRSFGILRGLDYRVEAFANDFSPERLMLRLIERVSENVPPFAFSAAAAAAGFYLAFGSHDGGSLSGTVGARLILAEPQLQVYLTVSFDDALPHVICFERK